jgi:parallel beta-helix repeat protein
MLKRIVSGIILTLLLTIMALSSSPSRASLNILQTMDNSEFPDALSAVITTGNISAEWTFDVLDWYQVVEISSDNERVFCGGYNSGLLYCLDLVSGNEIWRSNQVLGPIISLSEAPNHEYVGVSSENGNVYFLNASNGHLLWNYTVPGGVMCSVAISTDSNYVFVGHAMHRVVCLNASGEFVWEKSLYGQVYSLESSKSGEFLIAGQGASTVTSLSSKNGSINWNFKTEGIWNASKVRISSDDKLIVVASTDNNVYLLNASTGIKLWNFTATDWIKSACISPDNERVGVISIGAEVYCLQSSDGQKLWNKILSGQEGYIMWSSTETLELSPNGKIMVAGGLNKVFALSVINGKTFGEYCTLKDISGDICFLRVSNDGRRIVIGTYYNGVHCIPVPSPVWTVDDDGPADFHTIQKAINAASPGDKIYVYNGTYYENVGVNKTVSLIGENRNNTIINGYYTYKTSVLSVTADDVRISGFTIQNGWCGIAVYSSNGCVITENIATNNTYRGGGPQIIEGGRGVWLKDSKNCTVANNVIHENDRNVSLKGANNNTIINNTITNSLISYGIVLESSHNNSISNDVVKHSVYEGIHLAFANNNSIFANFVANNGDEGIQLGGSNNNIIRNIIENNSGEGIWVDGSNDNIIIGNTLINNKKRGILVWNSAHTIVYHNNFINNSWGQAFSNLINTWDNDYPCGGNYWSDHVCTGNPSDGSQPYIIDENNIDHYPFQDPNGWLLHELTVTSSPITEITFTINGTPQTTPYTEWLPEGPYTIQMPETHNGYVWSHWLEDGGPNRTKTITLLGTTWTGVFVFAVQPHGPTAEFTATPETADIDESVRFDASSSLPGSNGTHIRPITEFRWAFSDGNTTTTTSTSTVYHCFSTSGIYYVTLTVYALGATPETDSTTHKVTVVSVPVGGYSISIKENTTTTKPLTPYLTVAAILAVALTTIRRKIRRRTKRSRRP